MAESECFWSILCLEGSAFILFQDTNQIMRKEGESNALQGTNLIGLVALRSVMRIMHAFQEYYFFLASLKLPT
jgi:hypothetical protein